jgi:hypothetical protein
MPQTSRSGSLARLSVRALCCLALFAGLSASEPAQELRNWLATAAAHGIDRGITVRLLGRVYPDATIISADADGLQLRATDLNGSFPWRILGGDDGLRLLTERLMPTAPAATQAAWLLLSIECRQTDTEGFRQIRHLLATVDPATVSSLDDMLKTSASEPVAANAPEQTPPDTGQTIGTATQEGGASDGSRDGASMSRSKRHGTLPAQRERLARDVYLDPDRVKEAKWERFHGLLELADRQGWRDWTATRRGKSFLSERTVFRDTSTGRFIWRMTSDPANEDHGYYDDLAWNANGSLMCITYSSRTAEASTWLLNADGSALRPMPPGTADQPKMVRGCWSFNHPDWYYVGHSSSVEAINPFTGAQSTVTRFSGRVGGQLLQSHTSDKWFLYGYANGNESRGWVVGTDGLVQAFDIGKPYMWLRFTGSPDARIFYEIQKGSWQQGTMLPNGTGRITLTDSKDLGGHAGWTADGSWMTFMGSGAHGYARIRADGTGRQTFLKRGMGGCHGLPCRDGEWFVSDTDAGPDDSGSILYSRLDGTQSYTICKHLSSFFYASAEKWRPARHSTHPHPNPSPDGTKTVFNSDMLGQFSDTYVCINRLPDPPNDVQATLANGRVHVAWQQPRQCRETAGYCIYRANSPSGRFTRVTDKLVTGMDWSGPADSGSAYYAVTAVEYSGLESPANQIARAMASGRPGNPPASVVGKEFIPDNTPPEDPDGLRVKAASLNTLALSWDRVKDADVDHYNVYSSTEKFTRCEQSRLVGSPSECEFVDWGLRLGRTYWYMVTAVDRNGNESAPCIASGATPPFTPVHISALPDAAKGTDAQLMKVQPARADAARRGQGSDALSDPPSTALVLKSASSKASWDIRLPRSGMYAVWIRSIHTIDEQFTFSLQIGKATTSAKLYGVPGSWSWFQAGDHRTGTPELFRLDAGAAILEIHADAPGAKVAEVVITDDPSWCPVTGMSRHGPDASTITMTGAK